jgi:hypothetical protein
MIVYLNREFYTSRKKLIVSVTKLLFRATECLMLGLQGTRKRTFKTVQTTQGAKRPDSGANRAVILLPVVTVGAWFQDHRPRWRRSSCAP